MSSIARAILPCILFLLVTTAHAQSYREELDLGVTAYKNAHYQEAMQHFRKATELDASQSVAHLYLATVYVNQYIPGVESPENNNLAEQGVTQYQMVLNSDATQEAKINSSKGIAYLYLNMKKFDEAKDYYQKALALDANDPESYYSIGVIDWTQCYTPRMEARARLNMRPVEHFDGQNPEQKKLCDRLSAKNSNVIEDGIANLNKAIQLRPDYDDAMAYMNLMYRERADLECDDPAARERDLETADDWVDKTIAVKKAKVEKGKSPTAPNRQ